MNDRDKALLYRELATLSEAGFPVTKAAEAALDSPRSATERAFLSELKAGVEAGGKISEAAADASEGLSALEISIIEAAESGGRVPEGFAHLAHYFDLRAVAAKKIRAGLIYPAVLLHLAVFLPAVPKAVASGDVKGTMVSVGVTLCVIYLVVALCAIIFRAISKRARTSAGADSFLQAVPFVGRARRAFALSRFAEVMRMQLLCGRGPAAALRSAGPASGSGSISTAVDSLVLPAVEAGGPAGPAMVADAGKTFPPAFARSYATAEEAGKIDEDLGRWSIVFAADAETSIDRLASGVPKVIYFIVVIFVVYQIFQMANGYYGAMGEMIDRM